MAPPLIYFDVGSTYAYLALERAQDVLGVEPDVQPILLGALFKANGRSSWAEDPDRREAGFKEIERRLEAYGLPPLWLPDPWPGNTLTAMRAATYAHRLGRGLDFGRAAMRAAFAEGRDLSVPEEVFRVGERIDIHSDDLRAAVADQAVKDELRAATEAAHARGVVGVPTIAVGDELLWGDDRLDEAAALARGSGA